VTTAHDRVSIFSRYDTFRIRAQLSDECGRVCACALDRSLCGSFVCVVIAGRLVLASVPASS